MCVCGWMCGYVCIYMNVYVIFYHRNPSYIVGVNKVQETGYLEVPMGVRESQIH